MRQFRKPNIYNSKFWFHFSNNYVSKKYVKSISDCSSCHTIKQDLDNFVYGINNKAFLYPNKIYNLGKNSLLDMFPHKDLASLIEGK